MLCVCACLCNVFCSRSLGQRPISPHPLRRRCCGLRQPLVLRSLLDRVYEKRVGGRASLCLCIVRIFLFFFPTRGINYSACCKRPDPPHSYMCPEQEPLFHCGCRLPQIVKSLAYEKVISRYIKRLFMLLSSLSVCINFSETKSGNVCDCSDVGCRASHRPKLEFEVTVKCKSIRSTQLHLVLILLQCSPKAGSSR